MMNRLFTIEKLGEFEYITSLIVVDYPEAFIAKKTGEDCNLYIFDEIENETNYVSWICSEVSIDELDRLNKGICTLNSCFKGPRGTGKKGYYITSKSGSNVAQCRVIDDLTNYLSEEDIYVPPFAEDNHGAGVLSLVSRKPILSIILDEDKYCDPFVNISLITDSARDTKAFISSLPYNVLVKNSRACIQSNQSVVMHFEMCDNMPKNYDKKQLRIEDLDESLANVESSAALSAIQKAVNSGSDYAKLISALGNDKKTLDKYSKFMSTLSKKNDKKTVIQIVDRNVKNNARIELNSNSFNVVSENIKKSIELMNLNDKKVGSIDVIGYFEMFDAKNKGSFRLIGNDGVKYRGTVSEGYDIKKNPIVIQDEKSLYSTKLTVYYYILNGEPTESTYELASATLINKYVQEKLDI